MSKRLRIVSVSLVTDEAFGMVGPEHSQAETSARPCQLVGDRQGALGRARDRLARSKSPTQQQHFDRGRVRDFKCEGKGVETVFLSCVQGT